MICHDLVEAPERSLRMTAKPTPAKPMTNKPMFILVAGPYRSGTGDDPALMEANLRQLEAAALPLFRAGHLPMIGEWVALPLGQQAGARGAVDPINDEFLYPVAQRLLQHCEAVLRLPGNSKGADEDVRMARERGLPVYHRISDVPGVA
jgi:hypothetical protein